MLLQIHEPGADSAKHGASSSSAIGIDLGTTNSIAAIYKDGKAEVLHDEHGPLFMPSIITTSSGDLRSTKRMMHQPTSIISSGFSALTAAQHILKTLKDRAEKALGHSIQQAVITVPAYFDDTARQATKDAASLAGLEVLRLINEPTAAALAYGLDTGKEGTFVIYDLGGGTFDVSILTMRKGVFQVLAIGGHTQLGGDDIDALIAQHFGWDNLLKAKEAKENLIHGLTNELLELTCKPIIDQTLTICAQALKDANLSKQQIDGVVLVGGSTKLQALQKAVEKFFERKPLTDLDPDCVVAFGAALQAYQLTSHSETLLLDVVPISLGIETMGGIVETIIPRNSPIPISIAQDFTTFENGQTAISIHVVQGEREFVKDCRSLAQFSLTGIPPMLAGAARVRVTFKVDADGLLTVSATEQTTGTHQETEVKPSYGLNPEDYMSMLKQSHEHAEEDMNNRFLIAAKIKAEQLISQLESALQEDAKLLDAPQINTLKNCIQDVRLALKKNDRLFIQEACDNLSLIAQPFAEKRIAQAIKQKFQHQTIS
ncbi:MAG: Hsp70 family protein [Pseudomonadota bacterium]|jgi:molecular chaperone HscA|nr:Hsp70 family protein [Alphaproteobacteria bacterium]